MTYIRFGGAPQHHQTRLHPSCEEYENGRAREGLTRPTGQNNPGITRQDDDNLVATTLAVGEEGGEGSTNPGFQLFPGGSDQDIIRLLESFLQ